MSWPSRNSFPVNCARNPCNLVPGLYEPATGYCCYDLAPNYVDALCTCPNNIRSIVNAPCRKHTISKWPIHGFCLQALWRPSRPLAHVCASMVVSVISSTGNLYAGVPRVSRDLTVKSKVSSFPGSRGWISFIWLFRFVRHCNSLLPWPLSSRNLFGTTSWGHFVCLLPMCTRLQRNHMQSMFVLSFNGHLVDAFLWLGYFTCPRAGVFPDTAQCTVGKYFYCTQPGVGKCRELIAFDADSSMMSLVPTAALCPTGQRFNRLTNQCDALYQCT